MSACTPYEVAKRVQRLPQLPKTAQRLMALVNDASSTIAEIVDAVRYDPVITTELLRVCNSAYYGLARPVASVEEAVSYLGTAAVLQVAMSVHANAVLSAPQTGYGLRPGSLWIHSVAVAHAAERIAARRDLRTRGMLFTAGLLHDIGKLVLNEFVAVEYARIAKLVSESGMTFVDAEQSVLGFTHAEVGASVAEQWGLPASIVRCIRYHHTPLALSELDPQVDVVHVADAICLLIGVGGGDDGQLYRAEPMVLERLGLRELDIETIGAETVSQLAVVRQLFGTSMGAEDVCEHSDRR